MKPLHFWSLAIIAVGLFASSLSAAITITRSGNLITDIQADRGGTQYNYDDAELIGIDVTAYGGTTAGTARLILPNQGGSGTTPAPPPGDRAALLENLSMDRGFNNVVNWQVMFDQPIVNDTGIDVILFDFGDNSDTISVSIPSGTPQNYIGSDFQVVVPNNPSIHVLIDIRISDGTANTLTLLESPSTVFNGTSGSASGVVALGIDLTDLGVAPGGSASVLNFSDPDGTIDPLVIVGLPAIPEPGSLILLGVGGVLMLTRRRGM